MPTVAEMTGAKVAMVPVEVLEDVRKALATAVKVADEAAREWDAAPAGMKAGKLLIALAGGVPGYRADIDHIHAALAKLESLTPSQPRETV